MLIVTEGERTEPQYFEGLARHARATGVEVYSAKIIGLGRDPLTLVSEAVRRRDAAGGSTYDQVWCVCDVDDHRTLERAIIEAKRNRICMAITNPCFELWLLWHYREYRRPTDKDLLRRALRKYGCVDKNLPATFAYSQFRDAVARCRQEATTAGVGGAPENPGSTVAKVVVLIAGGEGDA